MFGDIGCEWDRIEETCNSVKVDPGLQEALYAIKDQVTDTHRIVGAKWIAQNPDLVDIKHEVKETGPAISFRWKKQSKLIVELTQAFNLDSNARFRSKDGESIMLPFAESGASMGDEEDLGEWLERSGVGPFWVAKQKLLRTRRLGI